MAGSSTNLTPCVQSSSKLRFCTVTLMTFPAAIATFIPGVWRSTMILASSADGWTLVPSVSLYNIFSIALFRLHAHAFLRVLQSTILTNFDVDEKLVVVLLNFGIISSESDSASFCIRAYPIPKLCSVILFHVSLIVTCLPPRKFVTADCYSLSIAIKLLDNQQRYI